MTSAVRSQGRGGARERRGPVRLGFVGAGFMGQLAHLSRYVTLPQCDVVAIADPRTATVERVAQRYGIPQTYRDPYEMLEHESIDALVCIQPFRNHCEILPRLFGCAPFIFIEKPLALGVSAGEMLVEAAERSATTVMVGYHKRCDPATVEASDRIARYRTTGELGQPTGLRITIPEGDWVAGASSRLIDEGDRPEGPPQLYEPLPTVFPPDVAKEYDLFVNYFVHQLNLARMLAHEELEVTFADPTGRVLLLAGVSTRTPVVLELTPYSVSNGWREHAIAMFERGFVRLDLPAPLATNISGTVTVFDDAAASNRSTITSSGPTSIDAMTMQALRFVAVARGEVSPPCDAQCALVDLRLAVDAIRSRVAWTGPPNLHDVPQAHTEWRRSAPR